MKAFRREPKSLLELKNWANGRVTLLANAGNSSDDLRAAVEAALRNNVNDILISSLEELKKGIQHLKNNNLGRASFYLKQNGDGSSGFITNLQNFFTNRQKKKIKAESSFKIWAADAVQVDAQWKNYFQKLLGKTAVVKDIDSAISLSQKYSDFRFVTLDGDLAEGAGLIESGSRLLTNLCLAKDNS